MGSSNGYTVAVALIVSIALVLSVTMINFAAAERLETKIAAEATLQAGEIQAAAERQAAQLQLERELAELLDTRKLGQ